MNSSGKHPRERSLGGNVRSSIFGRRGPRWLTLPLFGLSVLLCASPAPGQSQAFAPAQSPAPQPPTGVTAESGPPAAPSPSQSPNQQLAGSISGIVVDPAGDYLAGARVRLAREDQSATGSSAGSPIQEVLSGENGQFSFTNLAPGPFQLTITAEGFAGKTFSGTVQPGEASILPPIALAVAAEVTEVPVVMSRVEVAEAEIKDQEKQRPLGFIPNFYVSYVPDARPLNTKQKFELAWKTTIDPVTFGIVAVFAGVEQATNSYRGYGQGAQGYGKRFGAGYADTVTSTFIGGAIFPSLLKQDPRYFYKGTGSKRARLLYAVAMAVICKSDKGHWQPNYSGIMGSVASGGISNLYYPNSDRGAGLVFEGTAIGIGGSAVANVFQEFVVRKFTPHLPKHDPAKHTPTPNS